VERVCAREDVLDACKRRDLGAVITALCAQGVTQGQLSVLTGIPQGRISEYKTHKRLPTATSTFDAFANGLQMPSAARRALGLDPGGGTTAAAGGGLTGSAGPALADVRPVLSTLSRASAVPVLSALREIHRGYVEADRLMGSLCVTGPIQLQVPIVLTARPLVGQPPPQRRVKRGPLGPAPAVLGCMMDCSMRIRIDDFLAGNESPVII